jgi:prepilin-type N-terminal cleavage/methylation domain-containing protein
MIAPIFEIRRRMGRGFTLIEVLLSITVIAILLLIVSQLINNAAAIARTGNKHLDVDTEARTVLDRMAVDFAKMLKRTDLDYYIKAPAGYKNPNAHGNGLKLKVGQQGNDQIAFFSQLPGYYRSGFSSATQSPISLVAYRVVAKNSDPLFLQLQRMGKGLLWNGVDNTTAKNSNYPIVFLPGQIAAGTGPWAKTGPWYYAVNNDNTSTSTADPDYEIIGPQVFRMEYYYLLKDGSVTDAPKINAATSWDFTKTISANLNGFSDVEAIVVAIGVIDPATRLALYDPSTPGDPYHTLFSLMSDMADFKDANGKGIGAQKIGDVENEWNTVIKNAATTGHTSDGSLFPSAAASAIRVYNRYYDLKTL